MMKKYIKYMASLLAVSFAMSACIDLEETVSYTHLTLPTT